MKIRSIITQAGKFPVLQIPCHHYMDAIDLGRPRTGVLHTTEGHWGSSLSEFKVKFSPHFMLGVNDTNHNKVEIAQLVPVGIGGASTRRHNDIALVQIEMISWSKDQKWLPDQETVDALASLMGVCQQEWGIPLSHPWPDGDFGRYGPNPHRASGKCGKIPGWFGHGDMPDPDVHWDPGAFEWSKVFARCAELGKPAAAAPKDSHFADSGKPGAH